ncbi:MAG: dual OB domain-containing protein [Gemmatimonadaceae bacterium]
MEYTKTIVCLANSRKPPSGRCIAGRELSAAGYGPWVRPVSARPTQEISEEERRYEDGTDPRVLDVLTIAMVQPQPQRHQQENHVIDPDRYWTKRRTITWGDLQTAAEDISGPLWLNGYSSTHGENDRVPEARLNDFARSLYLIRPDCLTLIVAPEGGAFGPARRRVRARFAVGDQAYCVVVTDPWIERKHMAMEDGATVVNDALLCVSLTEVFLGFAYKLAASVITPQRADA